MTRRSEPGRQGEGEDRLTTWFRSFAINPMCPDRQAVCSPAPDDLVEAIVIEPDRHAARSKEYGHAIAYDQRPRMVHLEALAPMEFHREHAEGLESSEAIEVVVKFSAVMGLALVQWFRG